MAALHATRCAPPRRSMIVACIRTLGRTLHTTPAGPYFNQGLEPATLLDSQRLLKDRKTRIICTVGPATASGTNISRLLTAGIVLHCWAPGGFGARVGSYLVHSAALLITPWCPARF